jgi:hypothetical protein
MPGTPFALDELETPESRPLRGVAGGRARLTAPTAILLTAWALDEVDMPENRPPVGWSVEGALDGGDSHAGALGTPCALDEVDMPENRPPAGWPVPARNELG